MALYRRLLHAIDNYGLRGVLRRVLPRLIPGVRTPDAPHPDPAGPHPFDLLNATDTGGYIRGDSLGANTPSDLFNTAYYGIAPSTLHHALGLLPASGETAAFPYADFTFVDLGCGKGRALLVAAAFPFRQLVGIELSADLCAVARANAAAAGDQASRIVVRQGDATSAILPPRPLVLYLYHPFLAPALRRFLRDLARQRCGSPDPTYLLYANFTYPRVIARFPLLRLLWEQFIPLSTQDAAADRHGTTHERFSLFCIEPAAPE